LGTDWEPSGNDHGNVSATSAAVPGWGHSK